MAERIIAFDPGKKTGFAKVVDGQLVESGILLWEDQFIERLMAEHCDVYVCEDYIIRDAKTAGGYTHNWSKGEALRVIGAIQYHAARQAAPFVLQQPNIKPAGYAWLGLTYERGKKGDRIQITDAIVHANYYLHRNGGS